jgi:hypothetical protein
MTAPPKFTTERAIGTSALAPHEKALAQHESSQGASGKPSVTLQQDRKKPRKIEIRTKSMPESTSETSASKSQKKAPAAQESRQEVSKKPPHIPLAQDKPKPKPKPKPKL